MSYPRIYLAIDNCFASKRWTTPMEWSRFIANELGLCCIEASADTENDSLYTPAAYRSEWVSQVREAQDATGARVVNLYSGHGTYATLGLAHTSLSVRNHLIEHWFKPMIDTAAALNSGVGFFAHAFPLSVLDDAAVYDSALDELQSNLALIARYGAERNISGVGLEQMYTPHQVPWTVRGAGALLREVATRSGTPFYLTIDVGHQCAQRRFVRPSEERLLSWLAHPQDSAPWVGTTRAHRLLKEAMPVGGSMQQQAIQRIMADIESHPYLFAEQSDGDPYEWLTGLGCFSPIVHLQQTDGTRSNHLPFNDQCNRTGIIDPRKILAALKRSYDNQTVDNDVLKPCSTIYLTLEMFSGTADTPWDIVERLAASVEYWRRAIPRDGMLLDELAAGLTEPLLHRTAVYRSDPDDRPVTFQNQHKTYPGEPIL
jgi:D-erythrulose 1-phosphate 3-epimerase